MESSHPDDNEFPFDALNEIFSESRQQEANWAAAQAEEEAIMVVHEARVLEACTATEESFLQRTVELFRSERIRDDGRIGILAEVHADLVAADSLDFSDEERQEYEAVKSVCYELGDIAVAMMPGAEDQKSDIQLEIVQDVWLPPATKTALLQVIDELVPGDGLALDDPDTMIALLIEDQNRQATAEKRFQAQLRIREVLQAQTDFLKAHAIHPQDPAWRQICFMTSEFLSRDAAAQAEMAAPLQGVLAESLERLRLSPTDYEALLAAVRQQNQE